MHEITEKYKSDRGRYDDFRIKVEVLVRELLIQHDVHFHKLESRIKNPIKLDERIIRKNEKYKDLNDITDIVGVRIITYFEDEVDKIASIINSEFIVDPENSIDKRKLETDRFGYKSLHYVVTLSDQRKKLTEYKSFKDIKAEIQIRSILQHAWAEIEHDIGYKGEHTVPDSIKRNFFRVAALLETADIEFVNIKQSLSKYEQKVDENIKLHPEEVEINGPSVLSFIKNNATSLQLDNEIEVIWKTPLEEPDLESVSPLVNMLKYIGVKTIKELETVLEENKEKIIPFTKKWIKDASVLKKIKRGLNIFYLCYILVAKRNDPEFSKSYYDYFFGSRKHSGLEINEIYKEL